MLATLAATFQDPKKRSVAATAGGMLLFLGGRKVGGLGLFASGLRGLEKAWREQHPDVQGLGPRWNAAIRFYEQTHGNPVNRALHMAGIPIIVAGTVGMIAAPSYTPPWWAAAGAFTFGWTLNFIGHGVFEKNAPAFADDPLSFVAGPIWDLQQLKSTLTRPVASQG